MCWLFECSWLAVDFNFILCIVVCFAVHLVHMLFLEQMWLILVGVVLVIIIIIIGE